MTTNQAVNSPATQPAAVAAPAPGTYRIDAARSAITFTTRHPVSYTHLTLPTILLV